MRENGEPFLLCGPRRVLYAPGDLAGVKGHNSRSFPLHLQQYLLSAQPYYYVNDLGTYLLRNT